MIYATKKLLLSSLTLSCLLVHLLPRPSDNFCCNYHQDMRQSTRIFGLCSFKSVLINKSLVLSKRCYTRNLPSPHRNPVLLLGFTPSLDSNNSSHGTSITIPKVSTLYLIGRSIYLVGLSIPIFIALPLTLIRGDWFVHFLKFQIQLAGPLFIKVK